VTQPMLPLWGRSVIFVDWHGVLSRDLFWTSILADARHPLHAPLQDEITSIFAKDTSTAHDWMRGQRSSAEIIAEMRVTLPARYRHDYLHRKLVDDLLAMSINTELITLLGKYRPRTLVVVATDNMDCFTSAVTRVRGRPRTRRGNTPPVSEFAACVARCDDVICSSDVGTLKSESPEDFFGPWLQDRGLSFDDAVLIDDRADNCEAFTRQGGHALRWKLGTNPLHDVETGLERWRRDRNGRTGLVGVTS
jgi:hypothetical protein